MGARARQKDTLSQIGGSILVGQASSVPLWTQAPHDTPVESPETADSAWGWQWSSPVRAERDGDGYRALTVTIL